VERPKLTRLFCSGWLVWILHPSRIESIFDQWLLC